MATKAKASRGTLLQSGDGAGSETFTTIGEVKSIKGPGSKLDTIDATSQDSVVKEFIAGLSESSEVSVDMLFIGSNTQQQNLRADVVAGTLRNFKLIFNDHATTKTTAAFSALVTAFEQDAPSGGAYTVSCTLKPSGAITWTYAPA